MFFIEKHRLYRHESCVRRINRMDRDLYDPSPESEHLGSTNARPNHGNWTETREENICDQSDKRKGWGLRLWRKNKFAFRAKNRTGSRSRKRFISGRCLFLKSENEKRRHPRRAVSLSIRPGILLEKKTRVREKDFAACARRIVYLIEICVVLESGFEIKFEILYC